MVPFPVEESLLLVAVEPGSIHREVENEIVTSVAVHVLDVAIVTWAGTVAVRDGVDLEARREVRGYDAAYCWDRRGRRDRAGTHLKKSTADDG
ncbi:hypothetical protein AB2S56_008600 [Haloparvum sp. AD34]